MKLALVLASALLACHSSDPDRCPSGTRLTQPTSDFADIGYPDGVVACKVGSLATPMVWYNGVASQETAAAKLTAFMASKGFRAEAQAATASDLRSAAKDGVPTRLLFVKDGATVRYYATVSETNDAKAASLGWTRVDCATTPTRYECKL